MSEPQRDSFDSAAPAVPYIAYSYDPAGLVVGKTLGNGVEYAASFDAVNRQTSSDWQNSHHHTLAGYNYAYDDASNRKYEEKVHDPNSSQLYKYDTVYQVDKFKTGRLNRPKTNIPRPDRTQDWNYDPMGNWRQFRDSVDGLQRRNHNEVNEITEITEFGPRRPRHRPSQTRTALSYDANGNLLDDGEFLYSWDAFNRLIEVRLKRNSQIVGQYFYDAMHRRTKRLANLDGNASLETQATYIYDAFNCISEISNSGSEIKDYVWGNDINGGPQAAGGVGGLVAVLSFSPQPSAFYPLFDARGNITAYTGSSGSITATFDYLPFGALASSTGNADAFSYRFSTKPFDPEAGLVYYNFRYYSPGLGRWMGRDPIGRNRFQQFQQQQAKIAFESLYAFVNNDPMNKWDRLGLECEDEEWAVLKMNLAVDIAATLAVAACVKPTIDCIAALVILATAAVELDNALLDYQACVGQTPYDPPPDLYGDCSPHGALRLSYKNITCRCEDKTAIGYQEDWYKCSKVALHGYDIGPFIFFENESHEEWKWIPVQTKRSCPPGYN